MNLAAIADAIAARFLAVTPPADEPAVRVATADPPAAHGALPAVVVYLQAGELETGNGTRAGTLEFRAAFYLAEAVDTAREGRRLLLWTAALIDVLRLAVQLGGTVAVATVDGFDVGLLPYAGRQYAGVEVRVNVVTSEGWAAVA